MSFHRIATVMVAGIALLSGCTTSRSGPPAATTGSTTPASGGTSGCSFEATPGDPAPQGKDVGQPTGSEPTTGSVTLRTNQGEIKIALQGGGAPCTVRNFVHLALKKYFDNSPCHRLTTTEGLKVLQCGDPTGSGRGGPGYTIPDEKPTDLKAGKPGPNGQPTVIYPRGIVAMANTGAPHSGGSQFFIVYGDSTLGADYSVFGTIDAAGLAALDKVAAAGVEPKNGPNDGSPTAGVTIQAAVVGA